MKKLSKIKYYLLLTLLIVILTIINLTKYNDSNQVINTILLNENNDLKKEISELTNINYNDYNYTLSKIVINNLYESNRYLLIPSNDIDISKGVIGSNGLLGITDTSYSFKLLNEYDVSVKINNDYYIMSKCKIITNKEYNLNDKVLSSGLTSIPENINIGYINKITKEDNNYILDISCNKVENNYVAILKDIL